MTIKLLKQLISYSYNNNLLNPKNVNRIAGLLDRSDLKLYIRAIKIQERKLSVFIDTPANNMDNKDKFNDIFPNKNISYRIDPTLMLGARITADDMILDINLNNTLDNIVKFVEEDYD
jgi:hypothetical protein